MILTILSLCVLNLKLASFKEVYWETSLGPLVGYTRTSLSGHEFYAFEGVPYAKPPLGNLRFKAPVATDRWPGILNASHIAPHCVQTFQEFPDAVPESEDCLYLNIYTRNLDKQPTNDVLVAIFGGMFQYGTIGLVGPDYLMDHEHILFINFNYRTNIFGFLSFYDPSIQVPGNAGAKDVVMVLQWLQQHIHEFGGNPNKVTVAGCSSSGILINSLMLHPMAPKLFHQVIPMSGSVLTDQFTYHPDYESFAHFANYTGNLRDDRAFYNHLKKLTTQQLLEIYLNYASHVKGEMRIKMPLSLTIESTINNPDPFISESPDELILQGKFVRIPTLASFAQFEGGVANLNPLRFSKNFTSFTSFIPEYLTKYFTENEMNAINHEIRTFYYGNETPGNDSLVTLLNIFGDSFYLHPSLLAWKTMAEVSQYQLPIYMYEFNIRTALNPIANLRGVSEPYCCHCDELGYVFAQVGVNIKDHIHKPLVQWGIKTYTNMILNFVRTGNPNSFDSSRELAQINWKPISARDLNYLIVQPNLTLATNPFHERMKFWQRLYRKYLKPKNTPHKIYTDNFNIFP